MRHADKRASVRPCDKTKALALGITGKPPRKKCTAPIGSSNRWGGNRKGWGGEVRPGLEEQMNRLKTSGYEVTANRSRHYLGSTVAYSSSKEVLS